MKRRLRFGRPRTFGEWVGVIFAAIAAAALVYLVLSARP